MVYSLVKRCWSLSGPNFNPSPESKVAAVGLSGVDGGLLQALWTVRKHSQCQSDYSVGGCHNFFSKVLRMYHWYLMALLLLPH